MTKAQYQIELPDIEPNAIIGIKEHPTAGKMALMSFYKGEDLWGEYVPTSLLKKIPKTAEVRGMGMGNNLGQDFFFWNYTYQGWKIILKSK